MTHEELILKYFNNSISIEEEKLLQELLENDNTFQELFQEHRDFQLAFKFQEKHKLKSVLNEIDNNVKTDLGFFKKNKTILIAVASCLIIALFYVTNFKNSEDFFDSYFEPYPNTYAPIVRGEATVKTEAFLAYENGDFSKAEEAFKDLLSKNSNDNILFYYAMTLVNQNKLDDAYPILEQLKTKDHDFLDEVYWYAALIDVKTKKYKSAKTNIEFMETKASKFKKEARQQLLNDLKKHL